MIELACHCGGVKCTIALPMEVKSCNCSICRRYGVLWAYYRRQHVQFCVDNGPTDVYLWNGRELEFHRCRVCGCVTHWLAADPAYERMGINARLMDSKLLGGIPVVHGDGALM